MKRISEYVNIIGVTLILLLMLFLEHGSNLFASIRLILGIILYVVGITLVIFNLLNLINRK